MAREFEQGFLKVLDYLSFFDDAVTPASYSSLATLSPPASLAISVLKALPFSAELKQAIVRSLRLPIAPGDIGDDTSLFCEGLGLDSIDVLELERSFGVQILDEQTGMEVLRSVDTIAAFVLRERAKNAV